MDKTMKLKVGAQVMFTRNDQHKRWVNGTIGKVTKLSKDEIKVTVEGGETYVVPNCSLEMKKKLTEEELKYLRILLSSPQEYAPSEVPNSIDVLETCLKV